MAAGMMLGCWDGVYRAHRRRYLIVNRVVNALCNQIDQILMGRGGLWLSEWSRPTRVKHRAQHMAHDPFLQMGLSRHLMIVGCRRVI